MLCGLKVGLPGKILENYKKKNYLEKIKFSDIPRSESQKRYEIKDKSNSLGTVIDFWTLTCYNPFERPRVEDKSIH